MSVSAGSGVRVTDGVYVVVGVREGVRLGGGVPVSKSCATAVSVFCVLDRVSVLLLSVRIMPNVSASASVPITAMATISSLLRSRRRCMAVYASSAGECCGDRGIMK
jgi:hypothetical protein